ncbi:MAG: respiratory nitrate reductase subunit gamma [Proteobacteria bacterium]|nr:respiratory nitrate reductase subunit gamma [Pseudomonadota bacterium]
METVYYIVLVPMVYLAVAVFFVGLAIRLISVLKKPPFAPTLMIFPEKHPRWFWALADALLLPTVRRHNPVLWVFLMVFHLCFLLLLLGHLELITEMSWLQVWQHEVFMGRGFIGLLLAVSLLFFLFRRFISPTKDLSVPEDYFMLILLFLTVIFGAEMDWARRWYGYGELDVDGYRSYLMSLVTFSPDIGDVTSPGHSFMLVLHVFFANLFLAVFPFTHLMHSIFTFALNKVRRG